MKLMIDSNNCLKIKFHKTLEEDNTISTSCELLLGSGYNENDLYIVACTKQNKKDKYDKVIGKKIALERVLRNIRDPRITKESRARIWNSFWLEFKTTKSILNKKLIG